MSYIKRDSYLDKLIKSMHNGLIKVITGIRRSGKSYLLDPIFTNHLKEIGVSNDHIIKINLDEIRNKPLLDPVQLDQFIRDKIIDDDMYYVILDEIQLVKEFESVLNGLLYLKNVDVYVTGSNSKFLSSDILTEFRGRSFQIDLYPLSFSEYYQSVNLSKNDAYNEYIRYGGMPLLLSFNDEFQKSKYLKDLFELTYFKDIVERHNIQRKDVLEAIVNMLASSVGSLTNPNKLTNTFKSKGVRSSSINTVNQYLDHLVDAFLIEKVNRYDIKGKRYIQATSKYYFTDIGLRNARLNFRQQEENKIMENVVYQELVRRGYNVDVGIVEIRENQTKKQLEVDFVCNQHDLRYYIQVALNIDTTKKLNQELKSFRNIMDNFKKIIIVKDDIKPWRTEEGILVMGIIDFLLEKDSLNIL